MHELNLVSAQELKLLSAYCLNPFLTNLPSYSVPYASLSDAFDETNSFGVTLLVSSLLCGLLHNVFQTVSVHPIPMKFVMDCSAQRMLLVRHITDTLVVLFFELSDE